MGRHLIEKMKMTMDSCKMVPKDGRILAAVSGGADSVCLVLALKELGYEVSAVHVEHGIRGEESLADCAYVQALCRKYQIPLSVKHVDAVSAARDGSMSLEEAARAERYRAIRLAAEEMGIGCVATAHHLSDQAETVLWNLIRGSSVGGLGGIRPLRKDKGLTLIRPLILCERSMIESYLTEKGVIWRTDRTNEDVTITRNAIRLEVMPLLDRLNAGAASHIASAASDLRDVDEYLEEQTDAVWSRAVMEAGDGREKDLTLDRNYLASCPRVLRLRVIRRAIARCCGGMKDISRKHVEALERLCGSDCGHMASLPDALTAVSEDGILRLTRDMNEEFYAGPGTCGRGTADPAVTGGYSAAELNVTGGHGAAASVVTDKEGILADCVLLDRSGTYAFPGRAGIYVKAEYITWTGAEVPKKRYTKYLAYDTMSACLTMRTRRPGDYLIVNREGGRRKLKDYLIDEKVPRSRRDRLLLITQGSHVLWVIGMRISEGAKVSEGKKAVRVEVICPEGEYGKTDNVDPSARKDI